MSPSHFCFEKEKVVSQTHHIIFGCRESQPLWSIFGLTFLKNNGYAGVFVSVDNLQTVFLSNHAYELMFSPTFLWMNKKQILGLRKIPSICACVLIFLPPKTQMNDCWMEYKALNPIVYGCRSDCASSHFDMLHTVWSTAKTQLILNCKHINNTAYYKKKIF